MPASLEADVAPLHIAGGAPRVTAPPGTLAQASPRRAARARSEDLVFLNLSLHPGQPSAPGLADELARLAAEAYYGTPGSVTAALREAAAAVNDQLIAVNRQSGEEAVGQLRGRMLLGVLRGGDVYIAQCGVAQAALIRPGHVTHYTSEEIADRPLGASSSLQIRFHHAEVRPGDILVLTTASPPLWSDATLSGLAGLEPNQAVDRLGAASGRDLTGLLLRMAAPGAKPASPLPTPERARRGTAAPRQPHRAPPRQRPITPPRARPPSQTWRALRSFGAWLGRSFMPLAAAFGKLLSRMAPGLAEPFLPRNGIRRAAPGGAAAEPKAPATIPPSLLTGTAIIVPLIVVAVAALLYIGRGRAELFSDYLSQARSAVVSAQIKPSPADARLDWEEALRLLDLAERYDKNEDSQTLRAQAQAALDQLDLVTRLEFRPVLSGGFGASARINTMAATGSDLYLSDESALRIWHLWTTGRGYEVDREFDCLEGAGSIVNMSAPVDLVVQEGPGPLGTEGLVAIDADGTLLYCAPGQRPASGQLTSPDIGWGRIQAFDVSADRLYVLDPGRNAVYIYSAEGGLFSGNPSLYFVEQIPDLQNAVDLAATPEELFILRADGRLEKCERSLEAAPGGGSRILAACGAVPFEDERPGGVPGDHIPGALVVDMLYAPPPEPSLYFLDGLGKRVLLYSLRLVYQGQFLATQPLDGEVTGLALAAPDEMFIAAGSQVYYARLSR